MSDNTMADKERVHGAGSKEPKAAPRMIRAGEDSPALSDEQIEDAKKLIGVWLRRRQRLMTPFPGSPYRAARVPLTAGTHKITCADGCGITVYGYSPGVSYMFAGGLDLKPIVIL